MALQQKLGFTPLRIASPQPPAPPEQPPPPLKTAQLLRRSGSKLELTAEGKTLLLAQEHLRIVSLCGPVSSGKTSLVSSISETWLEVGEQGRARTQGVWAVMLQDCLILDTEGLMDESQELAALLLLLSSLLVYNSVGTVSRGVMTQLRVFSQARKWLGGGDLLAFCAQFRPHAPAFLWLLRDFTLPFQLTPKDYLEDLLRLETKDVAESRDLLLNLFTSRDCLALPRPQGSADPAFLAALEPVRSAFLQAPFKTLCGFKLSGKLLCVLITTALDALNSQKTIHLHNIKRKLKEHEGAVLLERLKQNYLTHMDLQLQQMPYSEADIASRLHSIRRDSQVTAFEGATKEENWAEILDEFEHFVLENEGFLRKANDTAAEGFNQRLLARSFAGLDENSSEAAWRQAANSYSDQAMGGSQLKVLLDYLTSHPVTGGARQLAELVAALEAQLRQERRKQDRIIKELGRLEEVKVEADGDVDALLNRLSSQLQITRPRGMSREVFLENILLELANRIQQKPPVSDTQRESARPPQTPSPPARQRLPSQPRAPPVAKPPAKRPAARHQNDACCRLI